MNAYDITVTTLKGSKKIRLRMESENGRFMDLEINMRDATILIEDLSKSIHEVMIEQAHYVNFLIHDLDVARNQIKELLKHSDEPA